MAAIRPQSPPDTSTVALWRWSLLANPDREAELWEVLSEDEKLRANRFYFPRDQRRYVVGRGTLRCRLAAYLNTCAKAVTFSYNEFGKPVLADQESQRRISFNVSHSDDIALLAVGGGASIGVDIERIRPLTDDFAAQCFAPDELAALRTLPRASRLAAAIACWTRKEAYVKAVGTGLSHQLDSFAVSVHPSLPAELLRVDHTPGEVHQWTMAHLRVADGYAAALAIRQRPCTLRWHPAGTP